MKIINNEAIKSTILDIAPHKIAVAYVGIDWKEYVNLSKDHIIIVSPTIGTNPDAVKQIADTIGWGNIYFLNELHAKIYIGVGAVLLSSSNLSRNGMEAEGLIEIGVLIESENERRIIEEEFNKILDKAESEYKDTESKKRALQKLYDKHRRAVANRIVSKNKSKNSFLDYRVLTDEDFYICWYTTGEVEYSDDYNMIRKNVEYEIHFRKGDTINPGKWVLMWKLTEANRPHKTLKPYWLFIHGVINDAIIEKGYPYPNCAFQNENDLTPNPPFDLSDKKFIQLFKEIIVEEPHQNFFIQKNKDFELSYSQRGFKSLMKEIKERYKD